ncbi:hypothetical protein QFZ82_004636 [Streptomyces sp. V4I23]|nr:hypothetical protein [Streptomyces sp. V4I23]
MPVKTHIRRARVVSALAAASLALVLAGCSADATSPADARADARADGAALSDGKQPGSGKGVGAEARPAVDCEKAKCIAVTFDAGPGKDTPRLTESSCSTTSTTERCPPSPASSRS